MLNPLAFEHGPGLPNVAWRTVSVSKATVEMTGVACSLGDMLVAGLGQAAKAKVAAEAGATSGQRSFPARDIGDVIKVEDAASPSVSMWSMKGCALAPLSALMISLCTMCSRCSQNTHVAVSVWPGKISTLWHSSSLETFF